MGEEDQKSEAVLREERILSWWEKHSIFEQSLAKPAPKGDFVFYEGPPTANGRPGIHHLESRAFKDALPRYKTMRGFRVKRRAGWDTHGLPVELEVEKQLGFSGKPDIEKYGVAAFNKKCRESVLTYIDEWSRFTTRIGYWVDQRTAYFTYDAPYMESLWNIIKEVFESGRLYKDYKVLPWCTRCGTALSSHELAQGYEEVKDLSVTLKFELVDEPGTFLLAWTTTPWTLPGNVALAVGESIQYGVYERDGERFVAAVERADSIGLASPLEVFPGTRLIGKKYKPLFDFLPALARESEKQKFDKAYQVYAADFVTTQEGTGIVHTAVMYGTDDFELGTAVGLPKVHAVAADGTFVPGTEFLEGRFVKEEDSNGKPTLAVDIIAHLKKHGLFFSQENHKHTYPFCWRCKTPLIYYARDSWYIRMTDLQNELVAENKKVNWEPDHIRDGRMGEWLSGAKDWAISRERYWGTPLPVWESEDKSERVVIGSVPELTEKAKKSKNRYFIMRHGEAEHNVAAILNSKDRTRYPLTDRGRAQAQAAAEVFKKEGVTKIFASPFIRAQETAGIIAKRLEIDSGQIVTDERIRELSFGDLDGLGFDAFFAFRDANLHSIDDKIPHGESYQDARKRYGDFLYDLEAKYIEETILIVSHGVMFESLQTITKGYTKEDAWERILSMKVEQGEYKELPFVPLPHNDDYELDLHRPYIDEVVLISPSGKEMRRTKEVLDVWFDSGAMPFAQDHYPFENQEWVDGSGYPADYIAEAVDQTRGWFYTLLAVGVLKKKGHAYNNVICLGHLLDKEGKKMSKSKGNVINPWEALSEWGADTLRFWMYSVNQAGDAKNFDEKTVKEADRTLSWFTNSAKFYSLFKGKEQKADKQILDTWMESRTHETVREVTDAMEVYQLYGATRAIQKLLEDLSQWYVRRIRDRARDGDSAALLTLRQTLRTTALLVAPFAPFVAEDIWQEVKDAHDPESVHLAEWPSGGEIDQDLTLHMRYVRESASKILKLRQQAGIVVRQPLKKATVTGTVPLELLALLAEEVNVEVVEVGHDISLDTTLTPELVRLRDTREFSRAVADARKNEGFSPHDTVEAVQGEGPHEVELSTGTVKFRLQRI